MSETKFKFKNLKKETLDKLTALAEAFNIIQPVNPVPVPSTPAPEVKKFGEGKLKDGTVIKWEGEALAVGVPVMVIDPANPNGFLPHPDASIELEDGTKITVKDGKVSELTPAQAPAVDPNAGAMSAMVAQMSKELSEVKSQFAAVTKEKTELEVKLSAQITEAKKETADTKQLVKQLFELVQEMIETPQAEPIVKPENKLSKKEVLRQKLQA